MKKAIGLAIAIVMPFLMGSAFLTSRSATAPPESDSAATIQAPAQISNTPATEDDDDATVDLLGNPVSAAIAKYKFDATGSLYESHSPQTELPRLAPPKS